MPMATNRFSRRQFLSLSGKLCALACLPLPALAKLIAPSTQLAASWKKLSGDADSYAIGIITLAADAHASAITRALDVPTRAHGLLLESSGTLLSVARRPGDWLLRWHPHMTTQQWKWIETNRSFNGHVVASLDGKILYTTETNLEDDSGVIGVRDAKSLEKIDEWSTGGRDPHQLLLDTQGNLFIANGGIATQPETGRTKLDLANMDSSLVQIDPHSGSQLNKWQLADKRLSLRHLAWNGPLLGIALQAQHDQPQQKNRAPVLAILNTAASNSALQIAELPQPLSGYGGDISAYGEGFAVSCPRSNEVALFNKNAQHLDSIALTEACALSINKNLLIAGGAKNAFALHTKQQENFALPAIQLDNHWLALA